MIAIAQMASRSPNPIDHWLLSWREGELPTPAEIDETVTMFLEHLGVDNQRASMPATATPIIGTSIWHSIDTIRCQSGWLKSTTASPVKQRIRRPH